MMSSLKKNDAKTSGDQEVRSFFVINMTLGAVFVALAIGSCTYYGAFAPLKQRVEAEIQQLGTHFNTVQLDAHQEVLYLIPDGGHRNISLETPASSLTNGVTFTLGDQDASKNLLPLRSLSVKKFSSVNQHAYLRIGNPWGYQVDVSFQRCLETQLLQVRFRIVDGDGITDIAPRMINQTQKLLHYNVESQQ